ncbi:AMP-binding protein [Epidermidibacterium keratini]|uniref:AMP-binding protein n=1 Tax=Epidermidibacterium keratini TaxID=1891644 RepID=A0A7L4YNR1_9ACTN|nr:AMP-binding protein [Epidermidibacterium keratini]QHC00921.1 AMP-binding protein [Epidermidibacterium keratini]
MTTTSTPRFRSPLHLLEQSVQRFADKPALVTSTRTLTYRDLDTEASRVAAALLAGPVDAGDTVSIYAQNRWEWLVAYHSALRAGAVVNPVNVMLTPAELGFVVQDCGATAIFTSADKADEVLTALADLPHECAVIVFDEAPDGAIAFTDLLSYAGAGAPVIEADPKSPSTIGYTSGTTGHPKGAVQSHEAVFLNCALTATMHARTSDDVVVTALPVPHVYGNVAVHSTLLVGGTVVLMERFEAAAALGLIKQHRATMFEGVPAMYSMLLAELAASSSELDSLTRCTVGGQTISGATIDKWESMSGAPLIELWGMTELSGLGTTHSAHVPPVGGSIGVSLPGLEVRVSDLEDPTRSAPAGTAGELMVRGPLVMLGYHGNPEATAEAIEPDGWLHTGDIATQDTSGYVYVVDRRKDMIITGGFNVYPAEIERVISAHPDVALVAVGPVPDAVKGELACAYVVATPGATPTAEDLMEYAARSLAAYKRPRMIRFVDALPTTSTGKIMRRELIRIDAGPDADA